MAELQKKAAAQQKSGLSAVPVLNKVTRGVVCGGDVPVCVIAVVPSGKEKLGRELLAEVRMSSCYLSERSRLRYKTGFVISTPTPIKQRLRL